MNLVRQSQNKEISELNINTNINGLDSSPNDRHAFAMELSGTTKNIHRYNEGGGVYHYGSIELFLLNDVKTCSKALAFTLCGLRTCGIYMDSKMLCIGNDLIIRTYPTKIA